ncbi:MAG TPA: GNAT family N-acetyltransferase [Herpetosiphonaceae bacterium]
MTTPAIMIRTATTSDVPAIVALNDGLFEEDAYQRDPTVNRERDSAESIEHFMKLVTGEASTCLLAFVDSTPVGYLAGYTSGPNSFRPIKIARLESIFVNGEWRSRNVGARLHQELARWAQAQGAERIAVSAYAANLRAIAFYERQGFTPYTLTLEHAIPSPEPARS